MHNVPGKGIIRCRCIDGRNVTMTEQLMAAHLGADVNDVHDFMCTWEHYADHVIDGNTMDDPRCRSWRWRWFRPVRCVYGRTHVERSKWHCSKNGGYVWRVR